MDVEHLSRSSRTAIATAVARQRDRWARQPDWHRSIPAVEYRSTAWRVRVWGGAADWDDGTIQLTAVIDFDVELRPFMSGLRAAELHTPSSIAPRIDLAASELRAIALRADFSPQLEGNTWSPLIEARPAARSWAHFARAVRSAGLTDAIPHEPRSNAPDYQRVAELYLEGKELKADGRIDRIDEYIGSQLPATERPTPEGARQLIRRAAEADWLTPAVGRGRGATRFAGKRLLEARGATRGAKRDRSTPDDDGQ